METNVIIPPRAAGLPLTGWSYRKEFSLSRASGAVTNYQMKLLVGESSGATGEDVDCGGHCLSNFNDLRFTKSDGVTLLDYWIESITGTTPNQLATVWIEFDSIGTDATEFYMYYGNSGAAAASSGANTFIQYHGAATESYHDTDATPTTGGLRYRTRAALAPAGNLLIGLASDTYECMDDYLVLQFSTSRYYKHGNNGTQANVSEAGSLQDNTYHIGEITYVFGSGGHGYIDGDEISTGVASQNPDEAMGLMMYRVAQAASQTWSFVSQYLATEPAWGTWGEEETG